MVSAWATCTIAGCQKPSRTRKGELCDMHYRRNHRNNSFDLVDRTIINVGSTSPMEKREISRRGLSNLSRRLIEFNGTTLGLSDWAFKAGLTKSALQWRLRAGWSLDRALTVSSQARGPVRSAKRPTKIDPPATSHYAKPHKAEGPHT